MIYSHEIDLDNMVILFQKYPVYRLNHMPPENIFLQSCKASSKAHPFECHRKFYESTMEEYRIDLAHIKAPVAALERDSQHTRNFAQAWWRIRVTEQKCGKGQNESES